MSAIAQLPVELSFVSHIQLTWTNAYEAFSRGVSTSLESALGAPISYASAQQVVLL